MEVDRNVRLNVLILVLGGGFGCNNHGKCFHARLKKCCCCNAWLSACDGLIGTQD